MGRFNVMLTLTTVLHLACAQAPEGTKPAKPSHGFEENPVRTIGMDACTFVLNGGACSDFVAANRDMIAAHEKMHEVTGADSLLCYTVEGVLTESKSYKEFSETKAAKAKDEEDLVRRNEEFCNGNFGETGSGYMHLKHHYVRNVPYGKADI